MYWDNKEAPRAYQLWSQQKFQKGELDRVAARIQFERTVRTIRTRLGSECAVGCFVCDRDCDVANYCAAGISHDTCNVAVPLLAYHGKAESEDKYAEQQNAQVSTPS